MSDQHQPAGGDRHPLPPWADPEVPESELGGQEISRRGLIRRAGLFGAGFAGATAFGASPAAAQPRTIHSGEDPELVYLVGDHHVHSVYSHDAKYTFSQQAMRASQFGLDWMVFTEHSNPATSGQASSAARMSASPGTATGS